ESEAKKIEVDENGATVGLQVAKGGQRYQVRTRNVILAAGGFEANPELRKKWMGPGWELAHTRGTPYNTGDMLQAAIDIGARRVGDF
ncbi:UNVERIFIED_CONTAM: FAD-binding protein, partial [Bacteroidetes bacterium 56_B9]